MFLGTEFHGKKSLKGGRKKLGRSEQLKERGRKVGAPARYTQIPVQIQVLNQFRAAWTGSGPESSDPDSQISFNRSAISQQSQVILTELPDVSVCVKLTVLIFLDCKICVNISEMGGKGF